MEFTRNKIASGMIADISNRMPKASGVGICTQPALESAEHFIFIEYFIIGLGKMWDQIHEILKRKAAQGVDVRTVAGLLGHAQPSTTLDIYSHAFDKNKRLAGQ